MEAIGTSGMKAALNGVPHLSIKDGWWIEGFNGKDEWVKVMKESIKNNGARFSTRRMVKECAQSFCAQASREVQNGRN